MEKKCIREQVFMFQDDIFIGRIEDAASNILKTKQKYELEGWKNLEFEWIYYDEHAEIALFGERIETDVEFEARIAQEERMLEKARIKLEKEKEKYLELKKKFEG